MDADTAPKQNSARTFWPLAVFILVVAAFVVGFIFDPVNHRSLIPNGKAYVALGQVVECQPVISLADGPYHSFIRTPKDEFFSVYWRRDFQPPLFGAAVGELKYHQCGQQGGVVVHCFDSFTVSQQRVKILDLNPETPKATK